MRFIILFLLMVSCGSKKVITETEYITKTDTLIVKKDRFITKKVVDTLFVENPCDSLGILKPFKNVLKTSNASITLESVNGNIEARINLDSIISSIESKYKTKAVEVVKENTSEIVKYRTHLWIVLSLVISVGINLLLLKKYIPFI